MWSLHRTLTLLCCGLFPVSIAGGAQTSPGAAEGPSLFGSNLVHRFRIEIAAADLQKLRQDPRQDVRVSVRHGDKFYPDTALHLKGRVGSFRDVDDKPGMTLSFDKFGAREPLGEVLKVHLNNSVEDPTYLNEALGAEIFGGAGVPAARVAHALVELNGRDLGLYVLKEAFTKEFLSRYFRRTDGNLYEPVPSTGEEPQIRRALGTGPEDLLDLKALAAAADESDLKVRWSHLQGILDVDRFFSFMALEIMLAHRDGYCLAGNNYRIYHDPETERLVFLPHGMDQLFGRADLRLRPAMSGPVARSLMEFPPARRLYRARAEVLFTNVFQAERLSQRVDQLSARVRSALAGKSVRDFDEQIVLLKSRIASRLENLSRQFGQPEPAPLRFTNSFVRPSVWRPVDVPPGGKLDHAEAPDKRPALHILAGLVTSASWRSTVLLESGRYRFQGRARTSGVKPMKFGRNKGAGLRVSSARLPEPHQLVGDSPWVPFNVDFDLPAPETELELICELRASAGDVWFDLESLKLSKR